MLAKKFEKKMTEEGKSTGIAPPELTDIEKLLEEITETFDEAEMQADQQNEKMNKTRPKLKM